MSYKNKGPAELQYKKFVLGLKEALSQEVH